MRLLIDFSAGFSEGAGIGRYARSVVPAALRDLGDWDVRLLYAAATRRPEPFQAAALELLGNGSNVSVRRWPLSRRWTDIVWFRAGLRAPAELVAGKIDVVYSPDFTAPPAWRTPAIVTVHDLAFLVRPEFAPAGLRAYLSNVVPKEARRAERVAVVSETTRRDVIERLLLVPERVVTIPNGVDERFFAAEPLPAQRRQELGLPGEYLLTVGTLEPRKNHLALFTAIERMGDRLGMPLVVAGRPGWAFDEIVAVGRRLQATGKVVLLDYVPEADLPGLYAGAAAVVYPSWYEGFGLPVVEGLAAGVPVVTSQAPALVEVGGQVTHTAPAGSAEALAVAIEQALSEEQRAPTARLARREQAGRYKWETSGRLLAELLREVGSR